eukprot:CAMPEP_0202831012 /NCGR_PEP_ID=MMETSP1389-20130828/16553_1 /ASSEMBLY_ACC=CAM_ASM_000865 /TAXON_ID=302021 /ORGANISM="Rhodomonas sp., Strain CCMP768" /LENGTH=266 /DNA_ID=CAMNT_0049504699 /DNA_START=1 /DNA_END=798 /DNA_ORIENTATION=-
MKHWAAVLVLRRFAIGVLSVLDLEGMLKAALTIITLTLLLAAHVFTRPYVDNNIDLLDFAGLCCLIFYAMTGMLMYPSLTHAAQGHVCGEGYDSGEFCDAENALKRGISVATVIVLSAVLAVSLWLTHLSVKEITDSGRAHKRITTELGREDDEEQLAVSANKVDLEGVLHGTAVCRWIHACTHEGSSVMLTSVETFKEMDALVREVKHDVSQYSDTPLASLLRSLCEIEGVLEVVCSQHGEAAASGLFAFVEAMVGYAEAVEREE